jgi:hypothetical protein
MTDREAALEAEQERLAVARELEREQNSPAKCQ